MKKITLTAIACLSVLSFAQLPTLRVATKNNATPTATNVSNGNQYCPSGTYSPNMMQQDANASTSGGMGYILNYIEATEIELSGADSRYNFKVTSSGQPNASDSIRRRGNSTSSGGAYAGSGKIPFRIKFDKKRAMFDRPAEKSWALLANYYDPSLMESNLAFYLGKKMGLDFTPNGYYVKLNVANQARGVYLLTEQIQRSEASVNIDKDDGWLAEFDYHCATSTADQKRYYHTGSNRYNINVKIREPDLDDLPLNSSRQPDGTCLDFVKNDLNALLDKMRESNFPNNGYRDYIDLDSYAKYMLIQLFMFNQDFNGLASNSTLLGSNYAYKNKGEKIKAGPLWDFDLSAYSNMNGINTNYQGEVEPRHAFYKRLWEDPVFRFRYKKAWNDYKTHFERISADNGVIDSITNLVANDVAGNVANGVSNVTAQSYKTHTNGLKTWWRNRINYFGQQVNNMSAGSDVAETAVAAALLNSKRNCREAVSSSSKANSSSSSNAVSSSSNAASSSSTVSSSSVASSSSRASSSSFGSSSSSSNRSSSSNSTTPILLSQNNPSQSTKMEVYNLHGKLVYSGYSENSQILKIPVQTGVYIVRTTHGSEKKVQRLVVK